MKNFRPNVKHGDGNMMVQVVIAAVDVGQLAFIDEIMDRHPFKNILEQHLKTSVESLGLGQDCIFQQANDLKNTARVVKEQLLYYTPRGLNSLDLSLIDHVWDIMKRKVVPTAQKIKKN